MFHIVYETTNLINGKKYRGAHSCKTLNDSYLGSGVALVKAIKQYGKENFERKILEICESRDHMFEREAFWVNSEWVSSRNTYNCVVGGIKTGKPENISNSNKGRRFSSKHIENLSLSHIGKRRSKESILKTASKNKGRKNSKETIEKMRQSALKRKKPGKLSSEHKLKISESLKGRKCSDDSRRKMSEAALKRSRRNSDTEILE